MSTAQVKQQTVAEREAAAIEWSEKYKPANLAEDEHNLTLIAKFIREKYLGFVNSAVLNKAVEELRSQLHWLAPAPTTPKPKGDVKNRLWNLGVEVARGTSMADKEAATKQIVSKETAIIVRARLLNEQSQLLEQKSQAEYGHVVMHRLGIDHYRTGEARKAAKQKLLPKLVDFNARCVKSGNDNLQVTPPTI